jgi:hypothetical protein
MSHDQEPIEREALHNAMLESLRREAPSQYLQFKRNTARVLHERGLPTQTEGHSREPSGIRLVDDRRFRELLWALINSGVLVQGKDSSNEQWPWLSVTELGDDYLKHGGPDVYDPDGYVNQVAERHAIDAVEAPYLGQAVSAFHADLPDAGAVMLGAAAEHVILLLAEAIGRADDTTARKVEKLLSGPVLRVLTFVTLYLETRKNDLPRQLREQLETTFAGVASMIRVARNDAGHPALGNVDRDHALVLLRLFPSFRNWAYDAIAALLDGMPESPG